MTNEELPWHIRERLIMSAKLGAPYEVCGVIVKPKPDAISAHRTDYWVIPIRNVARDPEHHFEMDGPEQTEAFQRYEVVGVYHSHPTGPPQPSASDRKFADPRLRQFIVTTDGVHEWSTDGND